MVKSFFTKTETQQPWECCWAWPYLPGPPLRMVTGEDAHGDHGCQMLFPWCRRMIGFMDLDSALWQRRGRLYHTWEKKHWQDVKCYWTRSFQGSSLDLSPISPSLRIHSLASCYIWRILCLNLSFVWHGSQTLSLSASAWGGGESTDNNVLVWKEKNIQAKISKGTIQTTDVSVLTLNSLMSLKCNRSFWLLRNCEINL